jgi:hypothetical protein
LTNGWTPLKWWAGSIKCNRKIAIRTKEKIPGFYFFSLQHLRCISNVSILTSELIKTKSMSMKSNAHPVPYFSAYPLKALNAEPKTAQQSPYLKAVLSGKSKPISRVRVLPMINPYKQPVSQQKRVAPHKTNLPKDIELSQKEWYNNYE